MAILSNSHNSHSYTKNQALIQEPMASLQKSPYIKNNDIIPLSKELTHVKAYIDIMNHRFSRKIELTYSIQPELDNLYILKSILQPLAENSIRHGFDTDEHPCDSIVSKR